MTLSLTMEKPIAFLNSNNGTAILAIGASHFIRGDKTKNLQDLQAFIHQHQDKYLFGFLSFELKSETENITSSKNQNSDASNFLFFVAETVVEINEEKYNYLFGKENNETSKLIESLLAKATDEKLNIQLKPRTTKEEYLKKVEQIKSHIQNGDIYEVNYCQEFYAEQVDISSKFELYKQINQTTKAPFSCLFQFDHLTIACGSPERYIQKSKQKIISQPIKGTAARGKTQAIDDHLIQQLKNDPKECAENVMIVDLVRNDFSKIAKKNSVNVDELMGIYTFETVHQMISTISCEIKESTNFTDIIKATFPMGSMTGAPKNRALEIIDKYEDFNRGIYSGSVGYIDPNGDFDFNVVIRSLIYDENEKYLSCAVGSAITIQSDAEKEYEECMVKINKILQVLSDDN